MTNNECYKILGISRQASQEEIKEMKNFIKIKIPDIDGIIKECFKSARNGEKYCFEVKKYG